MHGMKRVWVLVDKRGTILEHSELRKASLKHGAEVPLFTCWGTREAARNQVTKIRNDMTQEAWKTWMFRVVRYNMH